MTDWQNHPPTPIQQHPPRISNPPTLSCITLIEPPHTQTQARRMNQDPINDPLAQQVRQSRAFYDRYLLPRIRQFCDAKGMCV